MGKAAVWNGPVAGWGVRGSARYETLWRPKSSLRRRGDEGQKGEEGFQDSSELSRARCCHRLRREELTWRDQGFEGPVSHLCREAEDRRLLRFGALEERSGLEIQI